VVPGGSGTVKAFSRNEISVSGVFI
jgi:hypothetical protein